MIAPGVRARVSRGLEEGRWRSPPLLALSRAWARASRVERPLRLPRDAAVIGVGGSTLGGSGKTPLVLALCRALAERGERVAVVGHGYGARPGAPRCVEPRGRVEWAGDDAVWLARELGSSGVPVVVASRREAAVHFAARLAPIVVVDSLLQARPARLALSLLAVDAIEPWGAGACPPSGDLRAPVPVLLAAADRVVRVERPAEARALAAPSSSSGVGSDGVVVAGSSIAGARADDGRFIPLPSLVGARVGLVLSVGRPHRVREALHAHGIFPAVTRIFGDHAWPSLERFPREVALDAWLTTPKCATKLGPAVDGVPVLALDHRIEVPEALVELARAVRRCGSGGRDPW